MKILFYNTSLNYRGTTVALTDYAQYNQEILGNESIIAYNGSIPYDKDMTSEKQVVTSLEKKFNVIDTLETSLEKIIEKQKIDAAYFIRGGTKEFLPKNCKTLIHSVFQFKDIHGDRYAYISKWLSKVMSNYEIPYVPHIVQLPPQTENIKEYLNIDKNKIVIGRIGGYHTFDIPEVKRFIAKFLEKTSNYVFLFVGTEPFISHKNVIFINEIHDLQMKSNFINSCDAMLHARIRGESFGLSIAEFLYCNKPVIAWNGGLDQNHLELLKNSNTLYSSEEDLFNILFNIKDINEDWYKRVLEFNPIQVMEKFKDIFLK